MSNITFQGIDQFKPAYIDQVFSSIDGPDLGATVSLCHQCHYHVPAWLYHKNNKVYMVKHCAVHGISHHLIENDYEFYSSLNYTHDNPDYNMNGGVLIEGSDRCNLECPHCYHLPDSTIKDPPLEDLVSQVMSMPLGDPNGVHRIVLAGAEATLRKDFVETCAAMKASHPDMHVSVLTNGIRFNDSNFCRNSRIAGLKAANVGLNHQDYINNKTVRQKQITGIENMHHEGITLGYIGYTMISFDELDDILTEITNSWWTPKMFRIRNGSEIGRNATTEKTTVSDLYKAVERWCETNNKSFERIDFADNNIYHVMAKVDGRDIRIIQWCDETNINMEELRSGPWCNFVPDGITNFLHQVIRRDVWKNQGLILPDTPPDRYKFNRNPHDTPLDLLNLSWSSNNHEPLV
jgi:MoaA/NifB/PqqE/SkfB family radical SAM enzyme